MLTDCVLQSGREQSMVLKLDGSSDHFANGWTQPSYSRQLYKLNQCQHYFYFLHKFQIFMLVGTSEDIAYVWTETVHFSARSISLTSTQSSKLYKFVVLLYTCAIYSDLQSNIRTTEKSKINPLHRFG